MAPTDSELALRCVLAELRKIDLAVIGLLVLSLAAIGAKAWSRVGDGGHRRLQVAFCLALTGVTIVHGVAELRFGKAMDARARESVAETGGKLGDIELLRASYQRTLNRIKASMLIAFVGIDSDAAAIQGETRFVHATGYYRWLCAAVIGAVFIGIALVPWKRGWRGIEYLMMVSGFLLASTNLLLLTRGGDQFAGLTASILILGE